MWLVINGLQSLDLSSGTSRDLFTRVLWCWHARYIHHLLSLWYVVKEPYKYYKTKMLNTAIDPQSWTANNLSPSYKRATGMAMVIGCGNLGGAMASNFYRLVIQSPLTWLCSTVLVWETDALPGTKIHLGSYWATRLRLGLLSLGSSLQ